MRTQKKKTKGPRLHDVRSIAVSTLTRVHELDLKVEPYIGLSGNWLQNLRFNSNERVTITTMEKLLIIRFDEEK